MYQTKKKTQQKENKLYFLKYIEIEEKKEMKDEGVRRIRRGIG